MNEAKALSQPTAGNRPRKKTRFGVDHAKGQLVLGSLRVPLPKSRLARMSVGVALIAGGCLGFLPILGFWMIPLGFVILSQDSAVVRRWRRRLSVWWGRKRRA
jgi:hypothetical protein